MNVNKIMLGTAQFGMDYGIANVAGKIKEREIINILQLASQHHISKIDTAALYGSSESLLGKYAKQNFAIITKLPSIVTEVNIREHVHQQFALSLQRLKRTSCEGLLLHNVQDLLGEKAQEIYAALSELKQTDKVKKIGVSVYTPQEVEQVLENFSLDIIQFPLNIFDQRFLQNNFLYYLKKAGLELHARSIFLQGLLLMAIEKIPFSLERIKPSLSALVAMCIHHKLNVRKAAIGFVASIKEVDHCIFGIDNAQQLCEIIQDFETSNPIFCNSLTQFKCDDLSVINPKEWKLT